MLDTISGESAPYRVRLLDAHLDELLRELPALLVVGPRACGKTTTVARRAASAVRLNVPGEAAAFEADADSALRGLPEPLLLDEWQSVPAVLGAARRAVDADPRPARFLVTGSVRGDVDDQAWPGTGRIVRVPLYPMTVREQRGNVGARLFLEKLLNGELMTGPSPAVDLRQYVEIALRGGFPYAALQLELDRTRAAWLESYVFDLLRHDVEQAQATRTRPRDETRLRRYFEAYALNSAGATPHRTIYEAAQVAKATAESYERLLTSLYVIENVPAWTSNRLRRLTIHPKRYVVDAALLAAVLRVDVAGVLRDGDLLGRILDTFVAAQLRPELAISPGSPRLHHLRSEGGAHEVDLVVEFGGETVVALEIKATAAPSSSDARHLIWLRDQLGDRFVRGVVLHTGPGAYELADRVLAAPISALWA